MELYQVKSFLEIAKTANLTKAASKLHISPSALSSQIKSLEEELEVALFIRKAQGMALTNEGKALLTNAKKILHSSNKMIQKAQDLKENPSGNLNIGINTDPQFLKISLINQRVSQIMPKIKTSFIESQTFETIPMLFEEKIDTGFLYGSISNLMIYSIHLKTVPVCVAVPCSMAQDLSNTSFEQIVSLPWVWTRLNCPFHIEFKKHLEKKNLSINQAADAVDENIVRELFKTGTGAALMRKDEALELKKKGIANIWDKIELNIPLQLACLEKRKNERIIKPFFDLFKNKQLA